VQEVTPDHKVAWQLGRPAVEIAEAAQRLENGNTVIADNGKHAVFELTPKGEEVWPFDVPNNNQRPPPTIRSVRRLANGPTLICASTEDEVWEVSQDKKIVWRCKIPFPYLATRLENGNTLISSGDGYGSPRGYYLIEVDQEGKTVWKYGGDDGPADQQLKWSSGFIRLADGTTHISEAQGAGIRVISADKKILRVITSPAIEHPRTLVIANP
jgi:hypothetical protein